MIYALRLGEVPVDGGPAIAIEAVVGAAPGWDQPWSRAVHLSVDPGRQAYDLFLVDPDRGVVDARDVQLARLAMTLH